MEKNRQTICGEDCSQCSMEENCRGCADTNGSPFGGSCVAAEYIKLVGKEAYLEFKENLKDEINVLLKSLDVPETDALYELPGAYVNLEYPIPSGQMVKLLDDKKIYLGCQIEFANIGICYGVVADASFILISSYSVNGSEPEIVMYKKR